MKNCNMQRRHFELIARTIRELEFLGDDLRAEVAMRFAMDLLGTNTNFDKARFLAACVAPRRAA